MITEPDLTPIEKQLCRAAALGRLLDLRTRKRDEDDPKQGRIWGENRRIRAQLLRQLLTGQGDLDQSFGEPLAIRLRGASVIGALNLGGLTLRCPLDLRDCFLGGGIDLAKADAPQISLRGSVLRHGLSARQLRLKHNLNLSGGFTCQGKADLRRVYIGGSFEGERAEFINPGGEALTADRLIVEGSMFLAGTRAIGQIWLFGAHISGQLAFNDAVLENPGGDALNAQGVTVEGGMYLNDTEVTGRILLLDARISTKLGLKNATLTNPGGDALAADGLTVETLSLIGANVTGKVKLPGAKIGGQLTFEGAILENSGDDALIASRAIIGDVDMRPASIAGGIDMSHARVGGWQDDMHTWPTSVHLDGFVYETIDASGVTYRQRLDWLSREQDGYLPHPYEQLATVYRRAGDEQGARMVAIAKQRARRRAQFSNSWLQWPSQAWSWFLRYTIGYGYRPTLVLPYLATLFALGWWIFSRAYPSHVHLAKSAAGQRQFSPSRYSLDLLLPVANLHERDAFVPCGYAAWWAFGLSLSGWLLAAVVVAGLTGVFKRG